MFSISPGSVVPASRPMVGMRQQDSPAAPVSLTLPQGRVAGSTAASVNGEKHKPGSEGKVSSHPTWHAVRGNISCLKGTLNSRQSDLSNYTKTNRLINSVRSRLLVCKHEIRHFKFTVETADELLLFPFAQWMSGPRGTHFEGLFPQW